MALIPRPDQNALQAAGFDLEQIAERIEAGEQLRDLLRECVPEYWADSERRRSISMLRVSVRRLCSLGVPLETILESVSEEYSIAESGPDDLRRYLNDPEVICPYPADKWVDFQKACGIPSGPGPLSALILGGWVHTSDRDKRERFEAQIEFAAEDPNRTQRALRFLRRMSVNDWYR